MSGETRKLSWRRGSLAGDPSSNLSTCRRRPPVGARRWRRLWSAKAALDASSTVALALHLQAGFILSRVDGARLVARERIIELLTTEHHGRGAAIGQGSPEDHGRT